MQVLMIRGASEGSVIVLFDLRTGALISLQHVPIHVTHVQPVESAASKAFLLAQITKPFTKSVPVIAYPASAVTHTFSNTTLWTADKAEGTFPIWFIMNFVLAI